MTVQDLDNYIKPGVVCHMAGIGGVSMAPLSEVLHAEGLTVKGSDNRESDVIARLRSLGIGVVIGQVYGNVGNADFVIRTAAVHDDNPEIIEAREKGVPVFERAQAWGWLMRRYKNAVCVSGTHGKTTTTSMLAYILTEAGRDPTVSLGGTLPILENGHHLGNGDDFVIESCEYFRSFLSFFPTVAVILNIGPDHLDYYKDLDEIEGAFADFAHLVPAGGCVVRPADDKNTDDALAKTDLTGRTVITFGLESYADVRAENLVEDGRIVRFDVMVYGEKYTSLELHVPGHSNIVDALAACAAASFLGIDGDSVRNALYKFSGAGRRFEYRGSCNGVPVFDDYGHHPDELRSVMDICAHYEPKRLLFAFQPHTYTRTIKLFDDFVEALKIPDKVYLAEIYAAREENTTGISSNDLALRIPGSTYCPTLEATAEAIRRDAREGDLIVTVGAGDITKVAGMLVK